MAEENKEEVKLPPNQSSWWCEYKAENGKTLTGSFTFKRLTIAETGKLGSLIAQRNGGLPVDKITNYIHLQLSHFQLSIISAPEWWKPEVEYSATLLGKVFDALQAFEDTFQQTDTSGSPSGS